MIYFLRRRPWFAALPMSALLLAVFIYPTVQIITRAFDTGGANSQTLLELFSDQVFRKAMSNTIVLTLISVPIQVLIGVSLGLYLGKDRRMVFLIPILMLPLLAPPAIAALQWRLMLDPVNGPIAGILSLNGSRPIDWASNPQSAMAVVTFVDAWQWTPLMVLMFAVAAWSIDRRAIAVSALDGATSTPSLMRIIWDSRHLFLLFILIFRLIESLKLFDAVYVLTRGGPGTSTEVISLFIYRNSFLFFNQQVADLAAILLIALSVLITTPLLITVKLARR